MFFPFHDENPARRPAVVNWVLIAINVLALLWMVQLDSADEQALVFQRGFIPIRISQFSKPQLLVISAPRRRSSPRCSRRCSSTAAGCTC
jgi:hypothetical protein